MKQISVKSAITHINDFRFNSFGEWMINIVIKKASFRFDTNILMQHWSFILESAASTCRVTAGERTAEFTAWSPLNLQGCHYVVRYLVTIFIYELIILHPDLFFLFLRVCLNSLFIRMVILPSWITFLYSGHFLYVHLLNTVWLL